MILVILQILKCCLRVLKSGTYTYTPFFISGAHSIFGALFDFFSGVVYLIIYSFLQKSNQKRPLSYFLTIYFFSIILKTPLPFIVLHLWALKVGFKGFSIFLFRNKIVGKAYGTKITFEKNKIILNGGFYSLKHWSNPIKSEKMVIFYFAKSENSDYYHPTRLFKEDERYTENTKDGVIENIKGEAFTYTSNVDGELKPFQVSEKIVSLTKSGAKRPGLIATSSVFKFKNEQQILIPLSEVYIALLNYKGSLWIDDFTASHKGSVFVDDIKEIHDEVWPLLQKEFLENSKIDWIEKEYK